MFVLDGGLTAWGDRKTEQSPSNKGNDSVLNLQFNAAAVASFEDVKKVSQSGDAEIVDARPATSFAGGNIAGSKSLPLPSLLGADNKLKSNDEVKAAFAAAGVDTSKPIVFTCGGGVMATLLQVAASNAGITNTTLYDGSWSEYSTKM